MLFQLSSADHEQGYSGLSDPDSLIAQSLEHCTSIAEVMGLNLVQA